MNDLTTLLGRQADDPLLVQEVGDFGEEPTRYTDDDDGSFYMSFEQDGISFLFNKASALRTIHLFSSVNEEIEQGFARYQAALPFGLSFGNSRDEVHALLGAPAKSGGGQPGMIHAVVPYWDRYAYPECELNVQYSKDLMSILLVALTKPSIVL